jgi:HD containing hydrolase-like enzyme
MWSYFPNYSISFERAESLVSNIDTPPLLIQQIVDDVVRLSRWFINLKDITAIDLNLQKEERFRWMFMFYRDYVWVHCARIEKCIDISLPEINEMFWEDSYFYLKFLSRYHDISEWISPIWDIPTPFKIIASQQDRETLEQFEKTLIEIVLLKYNFDSKSGKRTKREALVWYLEKQNIEDQFLSYLDKIDALFVCLHEISWGNKVCSKQKNLPRVSFVWKLHWYLDFLKDVKKWQKLPLLQSVLKTIVEKYPKSTLGLLSDINSLLKIEKLIPHIWKVSRIHTEDNITDDFWIPSYWAWKKVSLELNDIFVWWDKMSWKEILTQVRR